MRRRRRAARGPLGGMGGSFILDVILHLELILCQEQILRLQSAMVLVGSGMSPRPGPDPGGNQPIRTRSSAWASRNEAENTVNELLTHYTSVSSANRWLRGMISSSAMGSRAWVLLAWWDPLKSCEACLS